MILNKQVFLALIVTASSLLLSSEQAIAQRNRVDDDEIVEVITIQVKDQPIRITHVNALQTKIRLDNLGNGRIKFPDGTIRHVDELKKLYSYGRKRKKLRVISKHTFCIL